MVDAESFAKAGFKYLGTPYATMDCQAFFEKCAADCGLRLDLKGANAWYRKFRETGWTGSPEDCKKVFGGIPNGAALFIHTFDGGEVKRGYKDGLGNAKHIGIKTGTGKGAIHSSESAECVLESPFYDKTVKNGGWNTIGLSTLFDYGDKINGMLRDGSIQKPAEESGEAEKMTAVVCTPDKTYANMRQGPGTKYKFVAKDNEVPDGAEVELLTLDDTGEWWKCKYNSSTGWIKAEFLNLMDQPISIEPEETYQQGNDYDKVEITVTTTRAGARAMLELLDAITDNLANAVGRG